MTENNQSPETTMITGKAAVALEHGPIGNNVKMRPTKSENFDSETSQPQKLRYPWYICFILGNEFCERFSYYGMKTILTIYFLEVLLWSESTSTLIYHLFSVLCYFTPLFGAMLADGWLGKFNTIFSLSIVYVAGLVLLTLASVPPLNLNLVAGTAAGLLLIGFGTGGIKPVVPAYGGDQFRPGQEKHRERFFSLFYFCINAGSLISTFVTPILRSEVPCFGSEGCWPLAFGLPAGLLCVALVAFLLGRPFYRNIPSKENIIAKVFGCCFSALSNKFRKRGPVNTKHWLDNASPSYSPDFVKDVKQMLPVLKMFLPLPIFWALFDQQGSRWTVQATKMDGRVTATYNWKPDQMQIFNPILILAFIPIFEGLIFPLLDKLKVPFKALARLTCGMVLAGVAFVIAGILQMQLDNTLPVALAPKTAELHLYNSLACPMQFSGAFNNTREDFMVAPYGELTFPTFKVEDKIALLELDVLPVNCTLVPVTSKRFSTEIRAEVVHSLVFATYNKDLVAKPLVLEMKEKPKEGRAQVQFIIPFRFKTRSGGGQLTLINPDMTAGSKGHMFVLEINRDVAIYNEDSSISNTTVTLDQGRYEVYYPDQSSTEQGKQRAGTSFLDLPNGGVYNVILRENVTEGMPWSRYDVVPPSSLSVFWQLPQIVVMTIGEVLFSVSGLAFAYSQAPASMKSVLQAGWLMAIAVGNVVVMIISGAKLIDDQATEYFVFAGLMGGAAVLFAVMSRFYIYVDTKKIDQEPALEKKQIGESDSL